ncbi:flagellar protein FlgN [Nocardioidaceae bacterium]|nr:flagellar protein FlgN [Nocardioidaceae bacterium]
MERLSLVLWREREQMETLLFKLEQETLVLASGRTRWLMRSAREVEAVLEQLRQTEIVRSAAADQAAAEVGLEVNASLKDLAEACEEPWQSILLEHRDAFEQLTREIGESADSNRALIAGGLRSARESLMAVTETLDGYAADGRARTTESSRQHFVDRSL